MAYCSVVQVYASGTGWAGISVLCIVEFVVFMSS